MKKVILIMVGVILVLVCVFLALKIITDDTSANDPDTKKESYVPCKIEYKESGGFLDTSECISLDAQNEILIFQKETDVIEYEIDIKALSDDIKKFILKYDLPNWKHKESDVFTLDAQILTITIECDNGFSFTLHNDEEIPSDKADIFSEFKELLLGYCK